MRVLVVIDAAQGCGHADGLGPVDGELAALVTVRRSAPDGRGVLEADHVLGVETGHLAPAAEVVDIDVPREVIIDSIHEALVRRGASDDPELAVLADALAAGMLDVAARHPVGTVLSHCGDSPFLWPTAPSPAPTRRHVRDHPTRGIR